MAGLLGTEHLTRAEIGAILDRARDFQPGPGQSFKRFDLLVGPHCGESFSRLRRAHAQASRSLPKRLGADAVSITAQASSVSKGESLVDTLNTLGAMRPDAIIMRHAASGAPHFLQRHLGIPIINAGDGTHEHPTQALLDARTILDRGKKLEGARVAIIGDIAHSRVARSNVYLLSKFGAQIVLCGFTALLPRGLRNSPPALRFTSMDEAIRDADVIMMLRVQLELQHEAAFPAGEYYQFYGLRLEHLKLAKHDAIVMHPGPINRGREISSEVADSQKIGDSQPGGKRNSLVRMAVPERVLGAANQSEGEAHARASH